MKDEIVPVPPEKGFTVHAAVEMIKAASTPDTPKDELYDQARFLFQEFRHGYVPKDGVESEIWVKWQEDREAKEALVGAE